MPVSIEPLNILVNEGPTISPASCNSLQGILSNPVAFLSFTSLNNFQTVITLGALSVTRRKNLLEQGENQQQTQPTYDAETENRTRATLVGGRVLSPLHHPCSPYAMLGFTISSL